MKVYVSQMKSMIYLFSTERVNVFFFTQDITYFLLGLYDKSGSFDDSWRNQNTLYVTMHAYSAGNLLDLNSLPHKPDF